jgi:putative transposase
MCRLLQVPKSSYYYFQTKNISKRQKENEFYLGMIRNIFVDNKGNFGSPRIQKEIVRSGYQINRKRVERLMRKESIKSIPKRKFRAPTTTDSNHNMPIAPNILNQDFSIKVPGKVYLSDITYLPLKNRWVYLCGIMDLGTRKIIGWTLKENMRTELLTETILKAHKMNPPKQGCVFHSDRGSQYASEQFRRILNNFKYSQSMSRKGNCYDNSPMESFFNTLKRELIRKTKYDNFEDLKNILFEYIDVYYNNERIHSSLGYLTPSEYEVKFKNLK